MKFCYNCGTPVENQQKYCKECGANLEENSSNNCHSFSNTDGWKKTIKTMNMISLCLLIPYVILTFVIIFFADFYTVNDRIMYMIGLLWPVMFVLFLFFSVVYIKKTDYQKATSITVHLVVSIISLGAIVLGGLMMVVLSYGMIVFPFASSIIHVVIAYKIKKRIVYT